MKGLREVHLLEPTLKSLELQDFKDFELIIVDTLWKSRNLLAEAKALGSWSFPIHVVKTNSWRGDGVSWIKQNACNQGIRHSAGEWILQADDCCEFPEGILSRALAATSRGSPHLLCVYKHSGFLSHRDGPTTIKTVEEAQAIGIWDNTNFTRDSRWVSAEGSTQKPELDPRADNTSFAKDSRWATAASSGGWNWLSWSAGYAYGLFRRSSLLKVNGYDERFDGTKPLGDVDICSRLEMAGLWDGFVDTSLFVYENQHDSIEFSSTPGTWATYDLLYLMRGYRMWRANTHALSEHDMKRVCNCEITNHDVPNPKHTFDSSSPFWESQRQWMRSQAIVEL